MTIVVDPGSFTAQWMEQLRIHLPEDHLVTHHAEVDPREVEFVVHWQHPTERILSYPNLKALVLASAGFDHIAPEVRATVPVVRLLDPAMADDIALYCLSWIIHFQRDFDLFAQNQLTARWEKGDQRFARHYTVGVLGQGKIGSAVRETISGQGFPVIGWSRSNNDRSLVTFFADCDVVVNLLPNNEGTRRLISTDLLSALGDGVLINVGRGPTVDSDALLSSLDGPLRAAVLDVFDTEPLPEQDPLWSHPKTVITPHIAGRTDPHTAAPVVANNIRLLRAGQSPTGLVHF
ncbi:MAG: NAD(P)-dependent oxidoreductase [Acidimicrobiales bacterium]